jgi:hypothetical protein
VKSEPERKKKTSTALETWRRSVLKSLNGDDCGEKASTFLRRFSPTFRP